MDVNMTQDQIFREREGNRWFSRNREKLSAKADFDWPCYLIDLLDQPDRFSRILELGCSNGYRLHSLEQKWGKRHFVGVDASLEAIENGKKNYPSLNLQTGILAELPLQEEFDLVILNFVLHWVDRRTLAKSISEIDRVLKEDGILVLGDFLPDSPQRRHYHHCPKEELYTYKQDYAAIFKALGTYQELARVTFSHDRREFKIAPAPSSDRAACVILHKSLQNLYPVIS